MKGKRATRERAHREGPASPFEIDRLRPWFLGILTALLVATPLLPSETALLGGSAMVLILLWLLLFFLWAAAGAARGKLAVFAGPTLWILVLFLAWHSISAIVMGPRGQPRAAINMLWQWSSFGLCYFLTRQWARTAAERRAIVAAMMSLAVGLSVLGYYQYFREFPLTRQHYRDNPDKVLREAGIIAPAGTPQRAAFENRLFSTEPFATFALTNSLAGFLSPWLVIALGIGITHFAVAGDTRNTHLASIVTVVLIAGCWTLTKSRTAWLATLFGFVLLAFYGRRTGWRPDARWVIAVVVLAVLVPMVAYVVGGLDTFVFLEASKAMLYRVQYWRSTAQMIADYPLFGCGPGNFQQYYTAYKLPEASETIADPHNFLFEIWATAGTPAIILFVAFWLSLVRDVWRAKPIADDANPPNASSPHAGIRAIYWGALAGAVFAAMICPALEGYLLSAGLLALGFPLAALTLLVWHDWVFRGHWPIAVPAIGSAVLLINLLAAGGIGFASVAGTLWVLAALLVNQADDSETAARIVPGKWALATTLGGLIALVLFMRSGYSPQLNRENWVADGEAQRMGGRNAVALESFRRAAVADPYSPDSWERLADTAHESWLRTESEQDKREFVEAVQQMIERNRRSSQAHAQVGRWYLSAYRRFGQAQQIEEAIVNYRIAITLYPNYNLGHAELAWALAVAGKDSEAAREAAEALRLDQLTPHVEQKLANQRLYDAPMALPGQPPLLGQRTAEQIMQELRSNTVPKSS